MSEPRLLVAAAVPKKATVRIPDETPVGPSYMDVTIERVQNATPREGQITWTYMGGLSVVIGAATNVHIISLPKEK